MVLSREETISRAKGYAEEEFLCSESVLMALADCLVVSSELVPRVRAGQFNNSLCLLGAPNLLILEWENQRSVPPNYYSKT